MKILLGIYRTIAVIALFTLAINTSAFARTDSNALEKDNAMSALTSNLSNVARSYSVENFIYPGRLTIEETTGRVESLWTEGLLLMEQKKYIEAKAKFDSALDLILGSMGKYNHYAATCINNLAAVETYLEHFDLAENLYLEAISIYHRIIGPRHTLLVMMFYNIGMLYERRARISEATSFYDQASQVIFELSPEDLDEISWILIGLGEFYSENESSQAARFAQLLQELL